jgi:hypothetical protein
VIPSNVRYGVRFLWGRQTQCNAASGNGMMARLGLAAPIPCFLILAASCQSSGPYYFRELKIDSGMHLSLTDGVNLPSFQEPKVGSYYAPFYGAFVTSVDHREKKPGAVARERSLYLETGKDQVLDRTVKTDEILKGPYGTVDLQRECFYTRPIQNGSGSVSVEFGYNNPDPELPSEVPSVWEGLPPLTSLSMVRIFRTSPGYVIVSANYERDGSLGSVNFGTSQNGNPTRTGPFGTSMYRTGDPKVDAIQAVELGPSLATYGIPTHIDVQKYLLLRKMPLPAVAFVQEENVMHEIYGFGKLIRQDQLKEGSIVASRWLQPSVTKEEKETLNTLCDARFLQQQAIGLRTVE